MLNIDFSESPQVDRKTDFSKFNLIELYKKIELDFDNEFEQNYSASLSEALRTEGKIVLFGSGRQGQFLYNQISHLFSNNISVNVWDNYVTNRDEFPVLISAPDYSIDKNTLIIIAINNHSEQNAIYNQLIQNGFTRIIPNGPLVQRVLTCHLSASADVMTICPKCSYEYGHCDRYCNFLDKNGLLKNHDGLVLEKIAYNVTTKCSLKCKHCGQKNYLYNSDTHLHIDINSILSDIDLVMKSIKFVRYFGLLGGEPLLHRDLHKIIEKLLEYDCVGAVVIFTNGTLLPWPELIEISKNPRVIYQADDYDEPYPKYQEGYRQLIKTFENNSINYFQAKTLTWFLFSDTSKRNASTNELKEKYNSCRFSDDFAIMNGYFFKCSHAFHEVNLKLRTLEDVAGDIYYIRDKNEKQIKDIIQKLIDIPYLKSCDYCGGCDFNNTVKAAIQIAGEGADK